MKTMRAGGFRWSGSGLILMLAVSVGSLLIAQSSGATIFSPHPLSKPDLACFNGDPRLEFIPNHPIHLGNIPVFCGQEGSECEMHFLPAVNGQTFSDGDRHSDMFCLFNSGTGEPVDQPCIVAQAPKGATSSGVNDLTARKFSAIWEQHVVTVPWYYDILVALNPRKYLIDSLEKLLSSPLTQKIFQTNIFLNCPVVPKDSTGEDNLFMDVFFQQETLQLALYGNADGACNPQIMFMFQQGLFPVCRSDVVGGGATIPGGCIEHLVASFKPGDAFYSDCWEIWTVELPDTFDLTQTPTSAQGVKALVKDLGLTVKSQNRRLNCPVVRVDGIKVPFLDALKLQEDLFAVLQDGVGKIQLPSDIANLPEPFHAGGRIFTMTEIARPDPAEAAVVAAEMALENPQVCPDITPEFTGKGGPPILLPVSDQCPNNNQCSGQTGPDSGHRIRWDVEDLKSQHPLLPRKIERVIAYLVGDGQLAAVWLPSGGKSYQQRAALLGRGLYEFTWRPEDGAQQADTTGCFPCHSQPFQGGGGRGLYSLEEARRFMNPPSIMGAGAKQIWRDEVCGLPRPGICTRDSDAPDEVLAFGIQGLDATLQDFDAGATRNHFGIRSAETIIAESLEVPCLERCVAAKLCDTNGGGVSVEEADACDPDMDGVEKEMSTGELMILAVHGYDLPTPCEANQADILRILHTTSRRIQQGGRIFRRDSLGCATCHTPFNPISSTTFILKNIKDPAFTIPIEVDHDLATQRDVDGDFADFVGQAGLRNFADGLRHPIAGTSMGLGAHTHLNTKAVWDSGSAFPLGADGRFLDDIRALILAHGADEVAAFLALSPGAQSKLIEFISAQLITDQLAEGSGGECRAPEGPEPPEP